MKNIPLQRIIFQSLGLIRRGVGVYIASSGVRVAEVQRTLNGFVLSRFAYQAFPDDIEDATSGQQQKIINELVAKCRQEAGIKRTEAVSSLPASKAVTRYFQIPSVSKKEQAEAIRFEGSRFVPYKLDDTVFDYQAKETEDKENTEVVFNAVQINALRQHVKQAETGSLKLLDTEPLFYALVRALQDKIDEKSACLILHFSAGGDVALCLYQRRTLYVCRDFFVSLTDQSAFDKFFMEVESSLEYFKRLSGDDAVSQIWIAGEGNLNMWKDDIQKRFQSGTKIEIAVFPVQKNIVSEQSSAYLVPIGLALRALGVKSRSGDISLLSVGAVAEERRAPRKWTGFVVLSLLLAGVIFYFGFFIPRAKALKNQLSGLDRKLSSLTAGAPELAGKSATALERKIRNLESKANLVKAFSESNSFLGQKFVALSESIPPSMWFSKLDYSEEIAGQGSFKISGRQLSLDGYVYFKEVPEEELRIINNYVDTLKNTPAFMTGFSVVTSSGISRVPFRSRNFTKFNITGSAQKKKR